MGGGGGASGSDTASLFDPPYMLGTLLRGGVVARDACEYVGRAALACGHQGGGDGDGSDGGSDDDEYEFAPVFDTSAATLV